MRRVEIPISRQPARPKSAHAQPPRHSLQTKEVADNDYGGGAMHLLDFQVSTPGRCNGSDDPSLESARLTDNLKTLWEGSPILKQL
jgi:hypothetical protein